MTKSKPKRDNAYYLDRLRREHPSHHTDFLAGKFKNLSEALITSGLRNQPNGMTLLKSAWSKATPSEKDAFKTFIGCGAYSAPSPSAIASVPSTAVRVPGPPQQRRALPSALATNIRAIMDRRRLKMGDVMREMGKDPLNTSVGTAMARNTQVQEVVIDALELWVRRNSP